MKKRFIILLDSPTAEQNKQFLDFVKESGDFAYWHWLKDSWLLTSSKGDHNTNEIRDRLISIFPGMNNLVIQLLGDSDSQTWSGYGPKGEKQNMFKWLNNNWSKD